MVETFTGRILAGSNAGIFAARDHKTCHRERSRNTAHVPPPVEAIVPFAAFVAARMRREAELVKAGRRPVEGPRLQRGMQP